MIVLGENIAWRGFRDGVEGLQVKEFLAQVTARKGSSRGSRPPLLNHAAFKPMLKRDAMS